MNHITSAGRTDAVGRPLSTVRAALLIAAATLLIGLWNLEGPEFWWDEGWTLSVARNVVERGHYGRLLDGQPAPGGLEASPIFPTCQRRLQQDYRARNRLVVWSGFWSASSALLR